MGVFRLCQWLTQALISIFLRAWRLKNSELSRSPVFFLINSLGGGGAERVFISLVQRWQGINPHVQLVLLHDRDNAFPESSRDLTPIVLSCGGSRVWRAVHAFFALYGVLWRRRPAVLLSTLNLSNIFAVLAGRLIFWGRRPRIIIREATAPTAFLKTEGGRFCILYYLARCFYRYADLVIAPSEAVRRDLIDHFSIPEDKIKLIYNPSKNVEIVKAAQDQISHRFFDDAGVIFVAVGRLVPQKGYDVLLTAFSRIYHQNESVRLIILGEGPDRAALEKQCEDLGICAAVDMIGFIDNPYPYIAKSDVFVLSSRVEGLPNVLIQALACGKTIVATDAPGGAAEILGGGAYGYLVPPDDPCGLADKMLYALGHRFPEPLLKERSGMFDADIIFQHYMAAVQATLKNA